MSETTSDAAHDAVRYACDDGVATLTLDTPENRNALSRRLVTGLLDGLDRAAADEGARVVLLRSSGRVFCSGADLTEASTTPMEEGARRMVEMQRRIVAHPKPVVVALHGAVRAGGLGVVAAADVVVTAREATFALTEVKLGLAPAVISLTVLPRLTSRAAALAALGGETFDGEQAAAWGLATQVVTREEVDDAAAAVCASLATGAEQGLRETKALLAAPLLARIDEHADAMVELSARLFGSDAAREAMTAFLGRGR